MFVEVSGFIGIDYTLPDHLQTHPDKEDYQQDSVIFGFIRWLSPHPNAILRDDDHNPICPAPFDINHCLWEFTRLPRRRHSCSGRHISHQLHMFPGKTIEEQRVSVREVSQARYDFISVDSIETLRNCTCIDDSTSLILETVTLPF